MKKQVKKQIRKDDDMDLIISSLVIGAFTFGYLFCKVSIFGLGCLTTIYR